MTPRYPAKVWVWPELSADAAQRISAGAGAHPVVARVLAHRGVRTAAEAQAILRPKLSELTDPFALPGMNAAADEILAARERGDPVVVFGDYDVDGLTATALLVEMFRGLGLDAHPFLPHRLEDGYGLQVEPLMRCLDRYHPGLVVTVDCGTSSSEAVRAAQASGVRMVVTDHHQPGAECSPAEALVNPRLGDPASTCFELAGVGVAFKLAHAVVKRASASGCPRALRCQSLLRDMLELVALGTMADFVPLKGDNRVLAAHGFRRLAQPVRTGLKALREIIKIPPGRIRTYDVGFLLAPRLNASGRLDSAEASLALLMESDPDHARETAQNLDHANQKRQNIQKEAVEQALDWIHANMDPEMDSAIVVADPRWHPGVIGIVASRLVQLYHRPTFVIALDDDGGGRGSGRSVEGVSLVECLDECRPLLRRHGGHAMAAGLDLDASRVDEFREAFREACGRRLHMGLRRPRMAIDAEVSLAEMNLELAGAISRLEPFGVGHAEPLLAARGVRLESPRRVGENHLRLICRQGPVALPAIGFGMAQVPLPTGASDIAFYLDANEWNGKTETQLKLQAIRPSE
ncbi:MAG: single-stranded-DNA-specific exonuclease RecJ [Kiritimatiellae bacterium]|nr:single-stranded-DNA-specific exonuclease RecJ [Kiritimatiellia bacterium]